MVQNDHIYQTYFELPEDRITDIDQLVDLRGGD